MRKRLNPQPWNLQAKDFNKRKAYAAQDWRFQMFFEYLRISPSYALAVKSNEHQLALRLDDLARSELVWKTRNDVGNIFEVLYREWWINNGLALFGVHASQPCIEIIQRLSPSNNDELLIAESQREVNNYIESRYTEQGRPDSILLSIPLGQKRITTIKQLKKLLTQIEAIPPELPKAKYQLENNKMRYRRLLAGLRLVYMRARQPKDELWRIAARAKISHSHGRIDPNALKKDRSNPEGRRMLTIMASRLLHDTLVIAENAATGIFPILRPISTDLFDSVTLGQQLIDTIKWEKLRKAELLTMSKT